LIIVSDTSPLSALAEIGSPDLLHLIFGQIVIPESVRKECEAGGAPLALREWIRNPPLWLHIVPDPADLLGETEGLDSGEAAAISFAWSHRQDSSLIIDERKGRRVAAALGLRQIGLIGIIGEAAKLKILNFDETVGRVKAIGFHVADDVIQAVRQRIGAKE